MTRPMFTDAEIAAMRARAAHRMARILERRNPGTRYSVGFDKPAPAPKVPRSKRV